MTDDTSPNGSSVDDGIRRDSHAEMDTGTGSDPSVMLDRGMPSLDGASGDDRSSIGWYRSRSSYLRY